MAYRVVSRKDESAQLFRSRHLEFWSRVHPTVPLLVYLPIIAWLLYGYFASERAAWAAPVWFLGGLLTWTLVEYWMHRLVFHLEPRVKFFQRILYLFHGVHHEFPNDSRRLVMPPAVSLPLAGLFYLGFWALLGRPSVYPFFAGFLAGYLCYDMMHYAIHHFRLKGRLGRSLRHHHLLHHFQDDERGFGVSSPLWDWVFRTLPSEKAPKQDHTVHS